MKRATTGWAVCLLAAATIPAAGENAAPTATTTTPPSRLAPAPALTLTAAAGQVAALGDKVSFDLEGATLATVVGWLRDAGVNVILPAALLPKADDDDAATMIVKVKDLPLGMVVEQFLTAGGYRHSVTVAEVDGTKAALVAIHSVGMGNPGAMMPPMNARFGRDGPVGGPPGGDRRPGNRQQGGRRGERGGEAANPNQPAAPVDQF